MWVVREVRAQYRQSAIDIGWSLATPVITLVGFGLVLTTAFGVDGDGVPYLVMAWTGMVVWQFTSNGLIRGASSLVWAADLVRKVAFPREVVPLATVASSLLDLVVGSAVLAVLMVVYRIDLHLTALAVVPVLIVLVAWTAAMAVLLATITAFVRDVAHGLGVLLRVGIFVTPVMYPASEIPDRYTWTLALNPIAVYIDSMRRCLLSGEWPDWGLLGIHAAATVLISVLGIGYLHRVEGRMADVI